MVCQLSCDCNEREGGRNYLFKAISESGRIFQQTGQK